MASPRPLLLAALAVLVSSLAACGGQAAEDAPTALRQVANGPLAKHAQVEGTAARLRTAPRTPSHAVVPILMYHVIAAPPPGAKFPGLWVAGDLLAQQVQALAAAGYHGVTLDAVRNAWAGRGVLPANPVVLSFDDGYLSQGQAAADALAAVRWPGVLNLVLHAVDAPGGLSSGRIRRMIAAGWEIDAHSLTHADLTALDAAGLVREVAGSRTAIQQRFGIPVNGFCYPAGRFDPAVEQAVEAAGFSFATTELPGAARPADDRFALPRLRVTGGETPATLLDAVAAAVSSSRS